MAKRGWTFLAALLSTLIVIVLFAGLDDLPRDLRNQIDTEKQTLAGATRQFQTVKQQVGQAIQTEPDLFRARNMAVLFPQRLRNDETSLLTADKDMTELGKLRQANRRRDRAEAERLLRHEQSLRKSAIEDAAAVGKETERWLDMKRHLPETVAQMEKDYQSVHSADLAAVTAAVDKAEADWPGKRADLEARVAALKSIPAEADKAWNESAGERRKAAANDLAGIDYAALFAAADTLHNEAQSLAPRSQEIRNLAGQLYDSWDKVLVDLEVRRAGEKRDYQEKVRTVRTHLTDVAAKKADTTTDEKWVEVSKAQYDAVEDKLGMAIEHKDAGKYDSEAERVAQPAGFAYIAPPSQGSNQYGYWDHRNGGNFWVWYGQYALLRDLLWGRNYTPLPSTEYDGYRTARSRGTTYYGRDETGSAPKYGSTGTFTQRTYSGSTYQRNGGYKGSEYATRPGGYRGSEYSSPASRSGRDNSSGRVFGSGRSREPAPSFRPSSPRPSYRPPMGGGRRFGGGGRRR